MARQMKDSGIEWIGEIPETWEVTKAKFILSANDGGVWGNDPADDGNDKIVIRSTEQTIDGKWCIEAPAVRDLSTVPHASSRILPGDLLITKSSGSDLHIGKTTLADEYFEANECYFSNFIQRIRCKGYLPRLLWYLFNSNIVREQFVYLQNTTSGIGNINADIIDNLFLPNPPLMMQQRIAAFLDRKCAEIDAVIERTKATIEEYKQLKQAVITEAVTKGVRGPRPMKDSGIEWIGEIPEEWEIVKMKHLGKCRNGLTYSPENVCDERGTLVLRSSNIQEGKLCFDDNVYVDCQVRDELMVKKGDILICSRNGSRALIGKNALIPADVVASFGAFMMIFRCECPEYVHLVLNSAVFNYYLGTFLTATINQLTADNFNNMQIVYCPDAAEQQEIVKYLEARCAGIDTLIAKKTALLTELETYKKSLIYEYVTGKKEVM